MNLTGIADAQQLTITLHDVHNGAINGDVVVPMRVLRGDTNGDGRVNVGDTNQTKANAGDVTAQNFFTDVNRDGRVNVGDTIFVKAHAGNSIAGSSRSAGRAK